MAKIFYNIVLINAISVRGKVGGVPKAAAATLEFANGKP